MLDFPEAHRWLDCMNDERIQTLWPRSHRARLEGQHTLGRRDPRSEAEFQSCPVNPPQGLFESEQQLQFRGFFTRSSIHLGRFEYQTVALS